MQLRNCALSAQEYYVPRHLAINAAAQLLQLASWQTGFRLGANSSVPMFSRQAAHILY
jgi:hypothetical protein